MDYWWSTENNFESDLEYLYKSWFLIFFYSPNQSQVYKGKQEFHTEFEEKMRKKREAGELWIDILSSVILISDNNRIQFL